MAEGASYAEIAQSEGREDYRARRAEAKSITEAKGTTTRVVKGVKFNEVNTLTPDMQSAAKRFEKYGYKIHVFIGSGETVDGDLARGFINGNDVYIQWDAVASPLKIALHEIVHSQKYEPILNRAQRRIIERMTQAKFDNIADTVYSAQYASITKDAEKYADELVCDVLSGLNTHGELVADIQSEFWDAFESRNLGYDASTYAVQQDAGGGKTSKKQPRAILLKWSAISDGYKKQFGDVVRKWQFDRANSNENLSTVGLCNSGDYFVVFNSRSEIGDFDVLALIEYGTEFQALVTNLRKGLDDGTIREREDVRKTATSIWGRGRSRSRSFSSSAYRRTKSYDGRVLVWESGDNSKRNSLRSNSNSGGNNGSGTGVKQSIDDTQFSFGRKWKPSKTKAREFAQTMDEIDKFCSENGIDRSRSSDSYYFTIDGQKYRVSNHTVEASNAKATNDLGETVRRKYHENGREDEGELILYLETEDGTTARVAESQLSEWSKGQALLKSRKAKGEKITAPAALKQRALQKLKERLNG